MLRRSLPIVLALSTPAMADTGEILEQVEQGAAEVETYELADGATGYRADECLTDTALPEGYPRPTAPEALEIKRYPSVRRAEVQGPGADEDGMFGLNGYRAFRPLFNHINDRGIAMTAPVEMDYSDQGWTMSFLYREPELGGTGKDGPVRIYDAESVTVIALGVKGDPDEEDAIQRLERWVRESGSWRIAGDPRKLTYNGPNIPRSKRWHEIQVPIERTQTDDAPGGEGG